MNNRSLTDMIGRELHLPYPPQRIISLVPSITELLFDLGLDNQIVGRTKFCIHPAEKVKSIKRIGGTKNVHIEQVKSLQPELIIANKEENTKEDIEALEKEYPVWVSEITDLDSCLNMINQLGMLCDKAQKAHEITNSIEESFEQLNQFATLKAWYLIWKKPYMTAGKDTFIHEMLKLAGFKNCCIKNRYPEISVDDMQRSDADLIMLSSEPFPFKEKDIKELEEQLPNKKIILVDGELFSWYGSRILHAANYFQKLREEI